jgi:sulfur-carrier protein adenylyltransferase/sulfurtransferase
MDHSLRYQRQMLLKELGEAGQQNLLNAKVLVIGAGGLGCPALQYLAAAGVGTIGIVDFDVVDISNLHRQVLYTVDDTGKYKAETAAKRLNAFNPEILFTAHKVKLKNENALQLISGYDLVIDGSDNFSTRYMVNDACVLLNKPLVYGAVFRCEGQVGVFNHCDEKTGIKTDYRDLFPKPPEEGVSLSCNETGVLGVVTGIIGTLQATEAIKVITGMGNALNNQVISYNILSNSFYKFTISPSLEKKGLIPETESEFINFNYDWFCGIQSSDNEISCTEFDALIQQNNITILDVREREELPFVNEFRNIKIPLSEFEESINSIDLSEKIVVFCRSGSRGAKAVMLLKIKFPDCEIYNLSGGILARIESKQNALI